MTVESVLGHTTEFHSLPALDAALEMARRTGTI